MAGGMDWFRWHHGSVTDPKFQLVARQAGASLSDVLAVWAYLLESASAAQERGDIGDIDAEALDCMFGFPTTETRTANIMAAMTKRGLLSDGRIAAWDRRQPKREDDTAADRKRRQREREHEERMAAAVTHDVSHDVTHGHAENVPCHAEVTHGHDRGEERREEIPSPPSVKKVRAPKRAAPIEPPPDVDAQVWSDWLALRAKKRAPVTATVLEGVVSEAAKAGMGVDEFLRIWCRRGTQGLEADWLKPHERRGAAPAETTYARQMRERYESITPAIAAKRPGQVIDMEAPNAIARLVG